MGTCSTKSDIISPEPVSIKIVEHIRVIDKIQNGDSELTLDEIVLKPKINRLTPTSSYRPSSRATTVISSRSPLSICRTPIIIKKRISFSNSDLI